MAGSHPFVVKSLEVPQLKVTPQRRSQRDRPCRPFSVYHGVRPQTYILLLKIINPCSQLEPAWCLEQGCVVVQMYAYSSPYSHLVLALSLEQGWVVEGSYSAGWSLWLWVASLVVWHMARVLNGVVQSPSLPALTGCNYWKGFTAPLLFSTKLESRRSFTKRQLDHRPRPSVMIPYKLGVESPK